MRHRSKSMAVLAGIIFSFVAANVYGLQGDCGQPHSSGDTPTASDSLHVLRAAIGLDVCARCVCDYDGSNEVFARDALIVLSVATGGNTAPACPACDPNLQCPRVAQFALFAGTRGPCATSDDCAPFAVCDPAIGRCRTRSQLDTGWTGLAHNGDVNDVVPSRLLLACDAEQAPCGKCQIVGLDPVFRNCRCANDTRTACFEPFRASDTCGGNECQCYFGPPTPRSSGNTPTCSVSRITAVGGDADVDAGAGTIELSLNSTVALGEAVLSPCPFCDGDAMPGDGIRDGFCIGGENDGMSCDAQSGNTTFPAPTGGRNSLDCFPSSGSVVSGSGVRTQLNISTGTTVISADLACSENPVFAGLECPCRLCSGDPTQSCRSDLFCAKLGLGTCDSQGVGETPRPNACSDGVCSRVVGDEGVCMAGPFASFCDGIVRANQTGLVGCLTDEDCSVSSLGVDGGNCTLVEPRPCFLDPIVAAGAPNPVVPLGAAAFCIPPTSNPSVNSVGGLVGPGRVYYQTLLSLFCSSDPQAAYAPGVGGCP